jgi:hypothetical protein
MFLVFKRREDVNTGATTGATTDPRTEDQSS